MSVVKELREMEPRHWVLGVATILAMIGPGVLSVFLYRPAVFMQIDSVKLILLSGSITLPLTAANFLVLTGVIERVDGAFPIDGRWSISAAITSLILYVAVAVAYVNGVPFRTFLGYAAISEVLAMLLLSVPWIRNRIFAPSGNAVDDGGSEIAA